MFAFDKSESFGLDKAAGKECPNLRADNTCKIFEERVERGFPGCVSYTCFGAGQRVTQEVFGGASWRDEPALKARMGAALSVLRRIHEQLVLLKAARQLPLMPEQHAQVQSFEATLCSNDTWGEEALSRFPIDRVASDISNWMKQLRGLVS
ncbi:hypothetical protein J7481_23370 [Labrenzia sp. R4_2]|uniref:hypothetical protein n=1 Tax=Labrenzia sp. R4_2 TaxID=2821107 RepID=UPI001ADB1084|nr:hypothetical protein [Labrenzia sp. R4_2]MBO9422469.1 hypothetical protein [Labrenzia sp. R4_2]